MDAVDYDVAIVGYGPVGELAAIMLGRRGFRVGVFERWPELYPLPRAVVYDDEIARVFQQEGLLEDVLTVTDTVPDDYEWRNRDGEALLKIPWMIAGPAGRQVANFFSQPELQSVLDRHARATPGVEVHTGWEVEEVADLGTHAASLRARATGADGERTATARYVLGADGAKSMVRGAIGTPFEDLGFNFDWLICDVRPHEERTWSPMNWQLCDPARPTTIVSGGPGRRRWEFMRLPGETIAELNTATRAWELLEPWGRTPENTTLERHAVYTFEARWAHDWRKGRLLLAGDAAHLMPPFAGQGMCSGMRDVVNLVWKLELVLTGRAGEELLDTYGPERSAHVQHFIHGSVALGQVICVLDEDAARERDARMIAGEADPRRVLPAPPPARLGPGVHRGEPAAGMLMPQGHVRLGDREGLLDELVPPGFLLLVSATGPRPDVDAELLRRLGVTLRRVVGPDEAAAPEELRDVGGVFGSWFASEGLGAVLVRPDSYVFGAVASPGDAPGLLTDLERALGTGAPGSARGLAGAHPG